MPTRYPTLGKSDGREVIARLGGGLESADGRPSSARPLTDPAF